jgi:hypothetical protein
LECNSPDFTPYGSALRACCLPKKIQDGNSLQDLGQFTAIVRGVNETTGVALVKIYDLH